MASERPKAGQEQAPDDEAWVTARLIESIKNISRQRHPHGPVKRFNQARGLGCLDADFYVPEQADPKLRQGLFAHPGHYPARIRFANATQSDDRKKDIHGMSIKVTGVPGETLWGEPGIQDFILNSYPVLFAATPDEFLAFTRAMEKNRLWMFFVNPAHWGALWTVFRGRRKINNPLAIRYWSTTPYRFGPEPNIAVKYSVKPQSGGKSISGDAENKHRLTQAMKLHLDQQPARFDFMVQFQKNPAQMPIEDASVLWDETVSPFHKVASITIHDQPFDTDQAMQACELISFNPWQCLPEHRPLGGINRTRKAIYDHMAEFRAASMISEE